MRSACPSTPRRRPIRRAGSRSPSFSRVRPVFPGLGPSKTTYNDDIIEGWVGIGSQLDGLGHIGVEHVYYNGNKLADFADPTGLKKLGIEKVPPMVARGVLLDMAAHYGTDVVKEGTAFNVKEIEEVAKKQGVEIRRATW